MKVSLVQSNFYGKVYRVNAPVRFYFKKDGTFDGIEVKVEGLSEEEQKLVEELCRSLANDST